MRGGACSSHWWFLLLTPLMLVGVLRLRSAVPRAGGAERSITLSQPQACAAARPFSGDSMASLDKSYLVPGWVESYSIWLMPKDETARKLQQEIQLLASQHTGAPVFQPHVTLIPDIRGPGEEVLEKATQLASSLKPYHINFLNITRGAIYFQCVYILCAKDQGTMHAGAEARRVYSMETPPYMPHLSLLYADIPQAERDEVVAQSHKRLYGEGSGYDTLLVEPGFLVDHLSLWYTPTEDKSTNSWCKVADVPLKP